ncbi:Enkurin domain containing protein [Trichuris trichiura]|uniref:Enkurin domain containing protein n=1 Tax=Trichuris trichiura TaxID=36087 RepID=A0A077ZBR9_TRITR|nr:Enkurin domain containing protein [Trichuris trichiura]
MHPVEKQPIVAMESRGPMSVLPDEPRCPRVRPEARQNYQKNVFGCGVAKLLQWPSRMDFPLYRGRTASRSFLKNNAAYVRNLSNDVRLNKVDKEARNHAPSGRRTSEVERPQTVEPLCLQRLNGHEASSRPDKADSSNKISGKVSDVKCARSSFTDGIQAPRMRATQSLDNLNAHESLEATGSKKSHRLNPELTSDAEVPNGCEEIPEEERRRIVASIHLAILDLYSKLGHLPVRTDTPGLIRKKEELNNRIEELEKAYEIFSKRRVYVRGERPSEA